MVMLAVVALRVTMVVAPVVVVAMVVVVHQHSHT
jgi:hypothetical protein